MAATTCILRYLMIKLRDLDCVGVSSGREVERVPESVVRLYRIFPDDVVRGVTVVARSDRVMARLQPCVILSPHHVAIHACSGIVRQIRISLGVHKGIRPQSECQAYEHSRHNQGCLALHETFRDKEGYSQTSRDRQRKVIVERGHPLTRKRRHDPARFLYPEPPLLVKKNRAVHSSGLPKISPYKFSGDALTVAEQHPELPELDLHAGALATVDACSASHPTFSAGLSRAHRGSDRPWPYADPSSSIYDPAAA